MRCACVSRVSLWISASSAVSCSVMSTATATKPFGAPASSRSEVKIPNTVVAPIWIFCEKLPPASARSMRAMRSGSSP